MSSSHLRAASRLPSWFARYSLKRAALAAAVAVGRRPALTYATYRTSSTSVHHAIRAVVGSASGKAHSLAPGHHARHLDRDSPPPLAASGVPMSGHVGDFAIRDQVVRRGAPADFVILVRDPIAVAVSLLGSFSEYWPEGFRARLAHPGFPDSSEAEHELGERLFGAFPRNLMLDWIRHDVPGGLGWDPLAHPFDGERGWSSYDHGPWRILVLHAGLGAARTSEALGGFLRVPGVSVKQGNSGRAFGFYGSIARAVAKRPEWVEQVFADPVARHLWTPSEREASVRRWTS